MFRIAELVKSMRVLSIRTPGVYLEGRQKERVLGALWALLECIDEADNELRVVSSTSGSVVYEEM